MTRDLRVVAIGVAAVLVAGATVAVTSYELRSKGVAKTPAAVLTELPAAPIAAACPTGGLPDGPDIFHVSQDLNGYLSGCFRVTTIPPGNYVVSFEGPAGKPSGVLQQSGRLPLTLTPASGRPGSTLLISGTLPGGPSAETAANNDSVQHAEVCIGCPGLEESADVTWSTAGRFSIKAQIPAIPWMGPAGPVPLRSGVIPVGVQCLGPAETGSAGCSGRIQGTVPFTVTGPTPGACLSNKPCAWLRLTPASASPGDVVQVEGWAPLSEVIGVPFGYYLHLSPGPLPPSPSPLAKAHGALIGFFAPASFAVQPGPQWASLGVLRPVNVEQSGDVPIATDPSNPLHLAYCNSNGIAVTWNGGRSWSTIPLQRANLVANRMGFQLLPINGGPPNCTTVTFDPRHPASLFGRFPAEKINEGIPPVYSIGLVSLDGGASWRPVPVPSGQQPEQFGGFREEGPIKAYFAAVGGGFVNLPAPSVEQTVDGGRTWTASKPSCPAAGACVTFAGVWDNNCAKFPAPELILYSLDKGKTWSVPQSPGSLDACGTDRLLTTADGRAVAISGRDEFHVLVSRDGGVTWSPILLPVIESDTSYDQFLDLELLPNGALLGFYGNGWALLPAGGRAWCSASGSLTRIASGAPTQIIGNRLWWIAQGGGPAESIALNAVGCSSQK